MKWLLPLALAGCSAPVALAPLPATLAEPCAAPVSLPARDATQAEVARWWIADRAALADCAAKHRAVVGWAVEVGAGR
jgi:hypothetical protein